MHPGAAWNGPSRAELKIRIIAYASRRQVFDLHSIAGRRFSGATWRLREVTTAGLPAALLKPKIRALFELLDAARELRRLASTGLNQQLALEALLLGGRAALTK